MLDDNLRDVNSLIICDGVTDSQFIDDPGAGQARVHAESMEGSGV